MDWYYAEDDRQRGPVSEAALRDLLRAGTVRPSTRVWHAGLPAWVPCGEALEPDAQPAAPDGRRFCAECGTPHPPEEMVGYQQVFLCAGCKDRFFQKLREGASLPGVREYGGFWVRLMAKLVDSVILLLATFLIMAVCIALMGGVAAGFMANAKNQEPSTAMIFSLAGLYLFMFTLIFGLQCAYNVWFLKRYSATPGKMMMGLLVISADGRPVTWLRALARFGAEVFITGLTFNIGYIIAAFDDEKRTLHDHICGTRVIRK